MRDKITIDEADLYSKILSARIKDFNPETTDYLDLGYGYFFKCIPDVQKDILNQIKEKGITALSLNFNKLSESRLDELISFISNLKDLGIKKLSMIDSKLSHLKDNQWKGFCNALSNTFITELVFYGNFLGDEQVKVINDIVQKNNYPKEDAQRPYPYYSTSNDQVLFAPGPNTPNSPKANARKEKPPEELPVSIKSKINKL